MTTECPKCGLDNAYFDGVEYVCPDCGYSWTDGDTDHLWDDDEY